MPFRSFQTLRPPSALLVHLPPYSVGFPSYTYGYADILLEGQHDGPSQQNNDPLKMAISLPGLHFHFRSTPPSLLTIPLGVLGHVYNRGARASKSCSTFPSLSETVPSPVRSLNSVASSFRPSAFPEEDGEQEENPKHEES